MFLNIFNCFWDRIWNWNHIGYLPGKDTLKSAKWSGKEDIPLIYHRVPSGITPWWCVLIKMGIYWAKMGELWWVINEIAISPTRASYLIVTTKNRTNKDSFESSFEKSIVSTILILLTISLWRTTVEKHFTK